MRAAICWVAILVSLCGGCASRPLKLRPQPRAFTQSDYERIYDAWTRGSDDFSFGQLRDVLHVTATFESWEFRWAYVVRYAHDHRLDPDTRAKMLRATLQDAKDHHRFFVTMVGHDYKESDLTSEQSAWRVLLVDEEGRTTVPVEIEKIDDPSAAEQTYFPSISPFRHAFRIVFPAHHPDGTPTIAPDAKYILLRFTGARGTVDLRWEFARGRGKEPETKGGPQSE